MTIWALQIDGKHNLHTGCCKKCYTNNFALIESLWTLREGDNSLMYSISSMQIMLSIYLNSSTCKYLSLDNGVTMTSKHRENINLVSFICLSFLVISFSKQLLIKLITLTFKLLHQNATKIRKRVLSR